MFTEQKKEDDREVVKLLVKFNSAVPPTKVGGNLLPPVIDLRGSKCRISLCGPFSETFELGDISMIYVVTRAGVNRRKMKLLVSKWAV